MPHTLKWFTNRIGKRIYRDDIGCCGSCRDVAKNGLIVGDEPHARHLHMTEHDFAACGTMMNYRDKP